MVTVNLELKQFKNQSQVPQAPMLAQTNRRPMSGEPSVRGL